MVLLPGNLLLAKLLTTDPDYKVTKSSFYKQRSNYHSFPQSLFSDLRRLYVYKSGERSSES